MTEQESDRRSIEEKVRTEGRLPPGQAVTVKFPVLHYGPIPPFNPETWQFRVWGEILEPASGPGRTSINFRERD